MLARFGLLCAIALVFTACQTSSSTKTNAERVPADKLLSASQLKALLTGKKMSYYNRNGVLEEDLLNADGSMDSEDLEGANDTGRWWIKEPNTLCRQWSRWGDGREICSQVVRDGDTYYAVRSGIKRPRGFKVVN